jgi:DNA-binding NarL/FixJ family response regulator
MVTTPLAPRRTHTPRVVVADDHPALRAGLERLLGAAPEVSLAGSVGDAGALLATVAAQAPDVVVLDYGLGGGRGLATCLRLKQRSNPPGVVLYRSGPSGELFAVPARVAQADALVPKSAPVDVLLDAISDVTRGVDRLPALDPPLLDAAFSRIDPRDLPIAGMLVAGVRTPEIAWTLGLTTEAVLARALQVLGLLQSVTSSAARRPE